MRVPSAALPLITVALLAIFPLCVCGQTGQAAPAAAMPETSAQSAAASPAGITEDELKQMLAGKTFYLRGGYLGDTLNFNDRGILDGHSPQGSYTLSLIQVEKVRLGKRRVQIEGIRYGLHFLGALPSEDSSAGSDRVRITPPKKMVRIAIARERVIKPKKQKKEKGGKEAASPAAARPTAAPAETGDTTTSPARAAQRLRTALARVFASNLDAPMMASMPAFWKLYYKAAAAKTDYRPSDPAVLREDQVDRKARLLTSFEPDSNQYAQSAGVAGMALYHVVIEPDGKPGEIAVARPIGFGLDENAVAAIRKARFQPAMKSGRAVPVLVDLIVEFRIYSRRTAAVAGSAQPAQEQKPVLPGPYSVSQPR